MAAFTHRDSRAGDPDLHTHVAISNKVQTGPRRAVAGAGRPDAVPDHRRRVRALQHRNWKPRSPSGSAPSSPTAPWSAGKRPVREIVGVDERLNQALVDAAGRRSRRHRTALTKTFLAQHGRIPTTVEMIKLSQQATLATREAKHEPRSLAEQREAWHEQALEVLGGATELAAMIGQATTAAAGPGGADQPSSWSPNWPPPTVATVAGSRASWRETNLDAEARRQVRYAGRRPRRHAGPGRPGRRPGRRHRTHASRSGWTPKSPRPSRPELTRADGQSIFRMAKGQLYTSPAILGAEARVVAAAGRIGARTVDSSDVQIAALEWSANNGGAVLNTAQAAMVTDIATTDRFLQLALAPAGTGKTTVMGVLARPGWPPAAPSSASRRRPPPRRNWPPRSPASKPTPSTNWSTT